MTNLNLYGVVLLTALLTSYLDYTRNNAEVTNSTEKTLKKSYDVPVIKFLICNSWGYRKAFQEYANVIQKRYSEVKVEGANYPPPFLKSSIASAITILKFAMIFFLATNSNPFSMLGIETPSFYIWASENKIYACLMLFFVGGAIESNLVSTGAFEIMINDQTIWSKIQSGRLPGMDELIKIIDQNFKTSIDLDGLNIN